jgi:Pvc16 N-terminal domain/Carboxypeptidase regulatory-like domain
MLHLLDELLRKILMDGVDRLKPVVAGGPTSVTDQQVGFAPPDNKWHSAVVTSESNALNVYLVDLRENRKLRSNERERAFSNGIAYDTPAPMRLDCHYLISAWSPTNVTPAVEPTLDEHTLLYQAAAVLANSAPFNPSRVYPGGSAPLNAWPSHLQNVDLPTVLAPTEGFPKLAEFWGTMGQDHRWKPVLHLVVTVPVELIRQVAGPMVTMRITEYRQVGIQGPGDIWIQIGGQVWDTHVTPPGPPVLVASAWVQLETIAGIRLQTTKTDNEGRFTFSNLRSGQYQLHVRAVGQDTITPIEVPSPAGEYDVSL